MKKIVVFFALLMFACTRLAIGADRDVLAHASQEMCWFAKVEKLPAFMRMDSTSPQEQTAVFARQNGPGQAWKALPPLTGRAVALACRSSQLAVLMSDGQWMTVWADGSANGQPLPAHGTIKTIADDGTDLWALGSVEDGIIAANEAIARDPATRPTTTPLQLSLPTTGPTDQIAARIRGPRLVVFREQAGRWATVTELPADKIIAPQDELSMIVVGGQPMVAYRATDGKINVIRCLDNRKWEEVTAPTPPPDKSIQRFCLFSDGYDPCFWQTTGNSPGEMLVDVSSTSPPLKLDWGNNDPLDGLPTATFSGGYVCVFGPHSGKIVEQRYERSGKPFETAAPLTVPTDSSDRFFPPWLEIVVLSMMGFSVGASVFQQWNQSEKPTAAISLAPAELYPRFVAGMIDLLPVVAAIAVLLTFTSATDDLTQMPSLKGVGILAAGMIVYLLHTTLTEIRLGRSVGKWLMGLTVVTIDGKTPNRSQLMLRNLLRVVDPLVMILVSPLRQRSADNIAGTVVVDAETHGSVDPVHDGNDDQGSDKTDSQ